MGFLASLLGCFRLYLPIVRWHWVVEMLSIIQNMIISSRNYLSSKKSKNKSTPQSKDLNTTAHCSSVRLHIDRNTSEKIAALRYDMQQRGEDSFSLSAVVEDAIEVYF